MPVEKAGNCMTAAKVQGDNDAIREAAERSLNLRISLSVMDRNLLELKQLSPSSKFFLLKSFAADCQDYGVRVKPVG